MPLTAPNAPPRTRGPRSSPSTTTRACPGRWPATCGAATASEYRIVRAESGAAGAGRAARDEAARRPGRGDPGRLPDAEDERHRVPRAGHGHLPRRPPRSCSPPTPTPAPPSTRSTWSTSTTTCSSRGTRRRRSSTRWWTRCWRAWRRPTTAPVPETKVVGHRWSARSSEVREFLARNQVPVPLVLRRRAGGRAAAGRGRRRTGSSLPVVITPDGEVLVEPSDAELAAQVGLATTPSTDFYDLIVIGGGPAGLGAARLRRLRGPADRAGRAHRHRRAGRAELPDRELPGLPRRRVRRPAHRPGPAAGRQVRRRAAHHPRGRRPGGQRLGPHASGSPTARRSTRTASSWPPASPTGSCARPGWTS